MRSRRNWSSYRSAPRRFLPGPGNWIELEDAWNLYDQLGCKMNFPNLQHVSLACRMRLLAQEPELARHHSGLQRAINNALARYTGVLVRLAFLAGRRGRRAPSWRQLRLELARQ